MVTGEDTNRKLVAKVDNYAAKIYAATTYVGLPYQSLPNICRTKLSGGDLLFPIPHLFFWNGKAHWT